MGIGAAFPSNAFPSNAFPDRSFPAWGAVVPPTFPGIAHWEIRVSASSITVAAKSPIITMEVE